MMTKRILDIFGLWRRDTWIIGNGNNAIEAYKAITSERNLGFSIVGFIASEQNNASNNNIDGIPVLDNDLNWLSTIDKKTQLLLQLSQIKVRFVIHGCVIL